MTINRLLEKYSITIEEARDIRALDSSTYFVKEEDSIGSREEFDYLNKQRVKRFKSSRHSPCAVHQTQYSYSCSTTEEPFNIRHTECAYYFA